MTLDLSYMTINRREKQNKSEESKWDEGKNGHGHKERQFVPAVFLLVNVFERSHLIGRQTVVVK